MPIAASKNAAGRIPAANESLGSRVDYATYLGGSGDDQGLGVAVDSSFQPYVTGSTKSMNFPTINPLTNPNTGNPIPLSGSEGAFITKFTADGSALIFSAYMGGSEADQGNAIAVGPDPTTPIYTDMYVAGNTTSPDFESTLLLQGSCHLRAVYCPRPTCRRSRATAETAMRLWP